MRKSSVYKKINHLSRLNPQIEGVESIIYNHLFLYLRRTLGLIYFSTGSQISWISEPTKRIHASSLYLFHILKSTDFFPYFHNKLPTPHFCSFCYHLVLHSFSTCKTTLSKEKFYQNSIMTNQMRRGSETSALGQNKERNWSTAWEDPG